MLLSACLLIKFDRIDRRSQCYGSRVAVCHDRGSRCVAIEGRGVAAIEDRGSREQLQVTEILSITAFRIHIMCSSNAHTSQSGTHSH